MLPSEAVPPAYGGGLGSDDSEAELGSISSGGGGPLSNSSSGTVAEEVIQVEGSVQQCVAALRGVATLLRGWQIRRLLALQQQHQQQYGGGVGAVAAAAAMQLPLSSMPMSPTGGNSSGLMAPGSPGGWVGWVGVCACVWGGGGGGARAWVAPCGRLLLRAAPRHRDPAPHGKLSLPKVSYWRAIHSMAHVLGSAPDEPQPFRPAVYCSYLLPRPLSPPLPPAVPQACWGCSCPPPWAPPCSRPTWSCPACSCLGGR